MTETDVQRAVSAHFLGKRNRLIVPNCRVFGPESDLLSVTTSDLVHEVEVKVDAGDFEREFTSKRRKHRCLRERTSKRFRGRGPNYFWFAVPSGLVDEDDVPQYAGLMEIGAPSGDTLPTVEPVRTAPRLHTEKMSDRVRRYLERGVTLRYWNSASPFRYSYR